MTALSSFGTSGTSPGSLLDTLRYLFEKHGYSSIRIEVEPEDFPRLPKQYRLIRRGGALWLTNLAARSERQS